MGDISSPIYAGVRKAIYFNSYSRVTFLRIIRDLTISRLQKLRKRGLRITRFLQN